MRPTLLVARRELLSFFASPMAYVVLTSWLVWSGYSFYLFCESYAQTFSMSGDHPLTLFFGNTVLFFLPTLALAPAVTMRLLAEETRTGTLESLMTAAVSDVAVVLGKYLAALVIWCALWAPTLLYVWLTSRYGEVDAGAVAASYLGIVGMGAYYMGIGLFASAVAPNQVISFVLSFVALGLLFVFGLSSFVLSDDTADIVSVFSVMAQMQDFSKGIVDTRYLVFDASLASLSVFGAVRALSAKRLA